MPDINWSNLFFITSFLLQQERDINLQRVKFCPEFNTFLWLGNLKCQMFLVLFQGRRQWTDQWNLGRSETLDTFSCALAQVFTGILCASDINSHPFPYLPQTLPKSEQSKRDTQMTASLVSCCCTLAQFSVAQCEIICG